MDTVESIMLELEKMGSEQKNAFLAISLSALILFDPVFVRFGSALV